LQGGIFGVSWAQERIYIHIFIDMIAAQAQNRRSISNSTTAPRLTSPSASLTCCRDATLTSLTRCDSAARPREPAEPPQRDWPALSPDSRKQLRWGPARPA